MKKSLVKYSSTVLSLVAVLFVSVASAWYIHQPKVPQELLKK